MTSKLIFDLSFISVSHTVRFIVYNSLATKRNLVNMNRTKIGSRRVLSWLENLSNTSNLPWESSLCSCAYNADFVFFSEMSCCLYSIVLIGLFFPFVAALHLHTEWEEVREGAMQRKRQLEGTLADGRGFEERRREVEAFLARLQARLDRMPPVGQTLDILEAQLKEQKVSLTNNILNSK